MKIASSFLLFVLIAPGSIAQDTLSVEYVKQFSSNFTIDAGRITGVGADILRKEFHVSQFVLLGETYSDAQIAMLTTALIPELGARGYRNFIIETGPHSAQVLKRTCSQQISVIKALHDFYTYYYNKVGDIPIPFFEGVEDATILQAAVQSQMNIVGIDQEYYSSSLLLFEELLRLDSNASTSDAFYKASNYVLDQHKLDLKENDHPLHSNLLNSKEIKAYFNSLDSKNTVVQSIIEDLTFSWKVYALDTEDRKQNLALRAKYMKDNFTRTYQNQVREGEKLPKFLIKMGSGHTMRGLTHNGVYDIGSLVNDLAVENGTKDLNIAFLFRYFQDDERELGYFDNSEGNSSWLRERKALIEQGKRNEWSVIDLRKLKPHIAEGKVIAYPSIQKMTDQFDIILIPPISFDVTLNYDE